MPHLRKLAAAIALACALPGCASPAGNVAVLQDTAVTPGATIAWAPLAPNEMQNGDPRIDNDIIRQRIRTGVETALTSKGYQFVSTPESAQYLITYHVGLQSRTDYRLDNLNPAPVACGWRGCIAGYGWGMYGAPTDVRSVNYTEGTMMLDLTDRASNRLAWRATSQRRVDQGDGSQERIAAMATDMVKSLPSTTPAS